jgi:hypothetical protein
VVGARAPGLDQLVREGVNGYLVEIKDEEALANRLALLIQNGHERRRMGKESRKVAEREFDWAHIAAQYVAIYQRILGESRELGKTPPAVPRTSEEGPPPTAWEKTPVQVKPPVPGPRPARGSKD